MKFLAAMLCLVFLPVMECQATIPISVVHISTDSALLTGHTCNLVRLKIDAAGGGDSFSILNCATWTSAAPQPPVNDGVPMLSVNVQTVGVYYDCKFLDEDIGTPVPYVEFDCHEGFHPFDMFSSGFDSHD